MLDRPQARKVTNEGLGARQAIEEVIEGHRRAKADGTLSYSAVATDALGLIEARLEGTEGGPHLVWDPWLLEALEPLDRIPHVRLLCKCRALITKASYSDGGIILGHWKRSKRPDGSVVLTVETSSNVSPAHNPHPAGFDDRAGIDVWMRRVARCPTCRRTFTYSPLGILLVWLRAVAAGMTVFTLGRDPVGDGGVQS